MEKAGRCFLPRTSGAGGVRGLSVVGRSAEARGPERIVTGPVQGPFETPTLLNANSTHRTFTMGVANCAQVVAHSDRVFDRRLSAPPAGSRGLS